jgi:hypothetical protein
MGVMGAIRFGYDVRGGEVVPAERFTWRENGQDRFLSCRTGWPC